MTNRRLRPINETSSFLNMGYATLFPNPNQYCKQYITILAHYNFSFQKELHSSLTKNTVFIPVNCMV